MSKFSVYLKELLEQRGEPIARIAKNTGLERTSIHKALKDERLLPYTALRQLGQYLQLSLAQMRDLNLYYEILLQGEDTYRTRVAICDLLSQLSQMHFNSRDSYTWTKILSEPKLPTSLLCGRPQIEAVIQGILQWETAVNEQAELDLYLPPDGLSATGLFWLWRSGRQCTVRQLVTFFPEHVGESARQENLHLLTYLLPVSLISGGRYFAYYCFEQTALTAVDPMPYFIITPHYLIRLDEKMSVAQFVTSHPEIALYKKHFTQILGECQPLNSYSDDLESILKSYICSAGAGGLYVIMTQPCLGHYYTRERIERHIRLDAPNREMLIELSDQRFEHLRNLEDDYYTIFTEDGLRELAESGLTVDLPPEFVLPIDRETRLDMLIAFREDIQRGKIKGCIADLEQLPIPLYLSLACDSKFGMHISATQGFIEGAYSCNLYMEESSIVEAFSSFIRSLPDSKYVYSTERTLEILDELILKLKQSS